jgi:acyl-CoA synthetase (NDP forming)
MPSSVESAPPPRTGRPLEPLLRPRSVAIIGASQEPTKRGHQAILALREAGYAGAVHPVNPRGGEILGLPVARSIEALPEAPDLALVCTPASTVPETLEACAAKGIGGAVVLALGFGEAGAEGLRLEERLREVVARTGIRVIGPNTSGLANLSIGLNLIGVRGLRPGRIALLGQSGNVLLGLMMESLQRPHGGLSICVGVGNEADVGFHELLDDLTADAATHVVAMYAEGVRSGEKFLEAVARTAAVKPVVLLKGGRSRVGRLAARSHTGALAGEYAVLRAALRQAGVIEVLRTDELYPVAETLAFQPTLAPEGAVVLLSDGGGHATLSADALSDYAVPLAPLPGDLRERLRAVLGSTASLVNPIDVAGAADRDPRLFAEAVRLLAEDPRVSAVVMTGLFGGYALRFAADLAGAERDAAGAMAATMRAAGKPFIVQSVYAPHWTEPLRILAQADVPVVASVEVACRCAAAAWQRGRGTRVLPGVAATEPTPRTTAVLATVAAEGRALLLESEARELVAAFGVPVGPWELCRTAEAAADAADRFGVRLALKAVAGDLAHKTEAGGIALDVRGGEAAADAFRRIRDAVSAHARDFRGVLVTPMQPPPVAELLVGVRRDPQFGPVLTLGAGGVTAEAIRDVTHRVLPVDAAEIGAMLDELRTADLLRGFRGRPAVDRDAIAAVALGLARCVRAHPQLIEIEVNPLFTYAHGAAAVDVRAFRTTPGRS